jgi:Holliday junction resolvase RusA-like endonuclease
VKVKASFEHMGTFIVPGDPEQAGSKNGFAIHRGSKAKGNREFTGRVAVVDTNEKNLKGWRAAVGEAVRPDGRPVLPEPLSGPLAVWFRFSIVRPRSVPKTRLWPSVRPDTTKYVRGTEDACTDHGLWRDDALIIWQSASKAYVGSHHPDGTPALDIPGCQIDVYRLSSGS